LKFKTEVRALLAAEDYSGLLDLAGRHGGKTGNILISLAGDLDELTRWRAIKGLGLVAARLFEEDPEQARRVLRQLIWNLNEESGGIGWGMPEAFGEILTRVPELAGEYVPLLACHLLDGETAPEPEGLQAGVVWALGRVKELPGDLMEQIVPRLLGLLAHPHPGLRGLTAWALGELNVREALPFLADLPEDDRMISLMTEGQYVRRTVTELIQQARGRLAGKGKEVNSMNDWKCSKCGYTLKADTPPETCPQCKEKCEFLNVTCYIPECGFSGTDQRLK
jgi:rubredoxin